MLLSLLSLVLTAPAAASDNATDDPKGPPPRIMVLHGDNDGGLYLEVEVTRYVKERRTEQVKNGDNNETREVEVVVPVTEQRRLSLDDKTVTVYGADGEKITAKALRRITPPVAVLVSADGRAVGDLYRQLLREDGLIVAAPALALSGAGQSPEALNPQRRPQPQQQRQPPQNQQRQPPQNQQQERISPQPERIEPTTSVPPPEALNQQLRQQAQDQARQQMRQQAQQQALQQAQNQRKIQKQQLEKNENNGADDKVAVTPEEQRWLDEILATKKTDEDKQKFKSDWKDLFDHKDRKELYDLIMKAKSR
jgi:hypothetical protein